MQVLTATLLSLDRVLAGTASGETAREAIAAARPTLSHAVERTRRLMFELRPPLLEAHGLLSAVTQLADHAGTEAEFVSTVEAPAERFPEAVETLVYRTVQEAIANIRRHAGADRVHISLRAEGGWLVGRVADNGCGFDASTGSLSNGVAHFGLGMLNERIRLAGGACRVSSVPGAGCTLFFTVPIENGRAPARLAG